MANLPQLTIESTREGYRAFLRALQTRGVPGWPNICPEVVDFRNEADRKFEIRKHKAWLKNKHLSQDELDAKILDFKFGMVQSLARKHIILEDKHDRRSGSILLFRSPHLSALDKGMSADKIQRFYKHLVILFVKQHTVYIYDPNYDPDEAPNRIKDTVMMRRLRDFISNHGLKKCTIKIGGGGNKHLNCVKMCRSLLDRMSRGHDAEMAWATHTMKL
ncbi:hypothetical protein L207DRAFT_585772 [Hyaloscypha variabilis F]|uniref:Uncharacterized protein n=1 Tax=Hyaloscypha variabilis (strain UAMH 11265 / GT02V1 / F) TaxID=1149755 RepID=A0A2J6RFZ0_HYAVF|nr:hypothetical protein L207DRAFT_585772 [Hyaloscypha variabilis F]